MSTLADVAVTLGMFAAVLGVTWLFIVGAVNAVDRRPRALLSFAVGLFAFLILFGLWGFFAGGEIQ